MRKANILELVRILESHDISEIEISRWGRKIRVAKATARVQLAPTEAESPPIVAAQVAPVSESVHIEAPVTEDDGLYEVRSPMVGTFYRAPAPDADPFVKVGDHISVGQPLCIIEAMKIMNTIESEISGKVAEILLDNAHPVEFNQVLFKIKKNS
jgi:acetyl-CoA carboxylase biotin carboxyl carrier protein